MAKAWSKIKARSGNTKKTVQVTGLGEAITQELTLYHDDVLRRVDRISEASIQQLATLTRASAPVGARGSFKKSIAVKRLVKVRTGATYVWYVKPPNHRLTHLLVKGHVTKDGGRTRAHPFLANAMAEVMPAYEKAIKEAIENG